MSNFVYPDLLSDALSHTSMIADILGGVLEVAANVTITALATAAVVAGRHYEGDRHRRGMCVRRGSGSDSRRCDDQNGRRQRAKFVVRGHWQQPVYST
jgi:hypothetical protein